MNIDSLASMFSQRSGVQQSTASTIMSTIMNYMMQHFMQKGVGSFLNSGGNDRNSMQSAFSQLDAGLNDSNHPLVQQVKQNCGLDNDNQARMYTQQATGLLKENVDNNPQGLSSLLGNFMGGGGIGNLASNLLGGKGQDSKQKKPDGVGDLLGL